MVLKTVALKGKIRKCLNTLSVHIEGMPLESKNVWPGPETN
jgi:hypothetical protein